MNTPLLRPSKPEDDAGLRYVWKLSFHDEDSFLDLFWSALYTPGAATVMECGGEIASAIFTLTGTEYLSPDGSRLNCPYVYSLCTLPEYRGRGFGAQVIAESVRRAREELQGLVCFQPASDSLRQWYASFLGTYDAFFAREASFSASELPDASYGQVHQTDAASYGRLRETLLAGRPHTAFSENLLGWQKTCCTLSGGGLCLLDLRGNVGAAIVERDSGALSIKELLLPQGDFFAALALLARTWDAGALSVRSPLFWGGEERGTVRPMTLATPWPGREIAFAPDAWWGPVYD